MEEIAVERHAEDVAFDGGGGIEQLAAYEAFAQEEYYTRAWQPLLGGDRHGHNFNFAAAFFGLSWCFYRKMYGIGLLLLVGVAAIQLLAVVVAVLFIPSLDLEGQAVSWTLSGVALIAIRVPFGFVANRVYFRKATRAIRNAEAERMTQDQLIAHLRKRGGTSLIGVGIVVAVSVVVRHMAG